MTTSTQTRTIPSPVSTTTATASAPVGRWSAFLESVRTRRAQRSELSRQIASYPATRGAGVTVLPAGRRTAAPSSRFWV